MSRLSVFLATSLLGRGRYDWLTPNSPLGEKGHLGGGGGIVFIGGGYSLKIYLKGEVHSRMAINYFYANKKFMQRYVIHQNFSF